MPFALLFIGFMFVITGLQNTYKQAGALVMGDFTGENNFIYWIAAIGIIGGIGYYKPAQPFSRAFIGLLLVVLVLSNGGLFAKLEQQLKSGTAKAAAGLGVPLAGSGGSGGGKSGGGLGGIGGNPISSGADILSGDGDVGDFLNIGMTIAGL